MLSIHIIAMKFWWFKAKLRLLVAIRKAASELKDDLRWVPPGGWCLLFLKKLVMVVIVGDDVSGLRVRYASIMVVKMNLWLTGNLEDKSC